jgi:flagellar basal body-associated protein FliL
VLLKRASGWILLAVFVFSFVYGIAVIVNSRTEHHNEEVQEIDQAIDAWTKYYVGNVETWQPYLIDDNEDCFMWNYNMC